MRYGRALFIAAFTLADTGTSAAFKLDRFSKQDNVPVPLPKGVQYVFIGAQMACSLFVNVRNTVEKMLEMDLADRSLDEVYRLLHELECLESDYAEAQLLKLSGIRLENFLLNRIILREGTSKDYVGKDNLNFRSKEDVLALRRKFLIKRLNILPVYFDQHIKSHSSKYVFPAEKSVINASRRSGPLLNRLHTFLQVEGKSSLFFDLDANAQAATVTEDTLEEIYLMSQCLMNVKIKLRDVLMQQPIKAKYPLDDFTKNVAFKKILEDETKRYLLQTDNTQNVFLFHQHIRFLLYEEAAALTIARKSSSIRTISNLKSFLNDRTSHDKAYLDRMRQLARYSQTITRDYHHRVERAQSTMTYSPAKLINSPGLKDEFSPKQLVEVKNLLNDSFSIVRERDTLLRSEATLFSAEKEAQSRLRFRHDRKKISDTALAGNGEKVMNVVGKSFGYINMVVFCMMTYFGAASLFSAPPFSWAAGAVIVGLVFAGVQAVSSVKWALPKIQSVFCDIGKLVDDEYAQYRFANGKALSVIKALGKLVLTGLKKLKSPLTTAILIFVSVKQPLFYYAVRKTLLGIAVFAGIASPLAMVLVALTAVSTFVFFHRQILRKGISFSPKAAANRFKKAWKEGDWKSLTTGVVFGTAMVCMTALTKAAGDYFGFGSSVSTNIIACVAVSVISFTGNLLFNFADTVKGMSQTCRWLGKKIQSIGHKAKSSIDKKAPGLVSAAVPQPEWPKIEYCKMLDGLVLEKGASTLSVLRTAEPDYDFFTRSMIDSSRQIIATPPSSPGPSSPYLTGTAPP